MEDETFEWADSKAESNSRKHGITFDAARRIFDDAFAYDRFDTRLDYGEDRFVITGMVNGTILTAAYTVRDGRTRIISARKATKHEQRDYYRSQTAE
jgi:uncharacterized DUF497 family protein